MKNRERKVEERNVNSPLKNCNRPPVDVLLLHPEAPFCVAPPPFTLTFMPFLIVSLSSVIFVHFVEVLLLVKLILIWFSVVCRNCISILMTFLPPRWCCNCGNSTSPLLHWPHSLLGARIYPPHKKYLLFFLLIEASLTCFLSLSCASIPSLWALWQKVNDGFVGYRPFCTPIPQAKKGDFWVYHGESLWLVREVLGGGRGGDFEKCPEELVEESHFLALSTLLILGVGFNLGKHLVREKCFSTLTHTNTLGLSSWIETHCSALPQESNTRKPFLNTKTGSSGGLDKKACGHGESFNLKC